MDHCAFLHERDDLGNTPLHIAASNGHEHLVQCLLDYGANYVLKNIYDNTPLHVSKTEICRQVIRKQAAEYKWDEDESRRMFQKQIEVYRMKIEELELMIQKIVSIKTLVKNDYELMERIVSEAKLFGLPHENVHQGTTCLEWMYTRESLLTAIDDVNDQCPIDHDKKLECVDHLLHLIQETERKLKDSEQQVKGDSPIVVAVPDFITSAHQNALHTHQKSMAEYELSLIFHRLRSLEILVDTNNGDEIPLLMLQNAIDTSMKQNADASFVQSASNLLGKLTYELDLHTFLKDAPSVKLPVPDMTVEEATSSWEHRRDIGYLDENDGYYPLPHPENGYVWIKSESLQTLESYLNSLNEKIHQSSQFDANQKLMDSAKATQTEKQRELKILSEKNESDKLAAIEVAEKAARKQKKNKKKKNVKK